MDEIKPVNTLYEAYAIAREANNPTEMERLTVEIYQEAEFIARHYWNGPRERTHFPTQLNREIHELNWDNLYTIVVNCLQYYDPTYISNVYPGQNVKFSTYLTDAINNQPKKSFEFLNAQKREGQLHNSEFEEKFHADGTANLSAEENELISKITEKLRPIGEAYPRNMRFYLEHYVGEKTLEKIGEENGGLTKERIRQCVAVITEKIGRKLKKLYDECTDEDSKTVQEDKKQFAKALKTALAQLGKEVGIAPNADPLPLDSDQPSREEQLRKSNPNGDLTKPSFTEMLEASHKNGENFVQFLFDRVLPAWDNMSQVKFCEHLKSLNTKHQSADEPITDQKDTFTDTVLSQWHSGQTRPARGNVEVICRAFGYTPGKSQLMSKHEKMLWRAIRGHRFTWTGSDKQVLTGKEAINAAIAEARTTKHHGNLLAELLSASGIPSEIVEQLAGVDQPSTLCTGQHIKNLDKAGNLLSLLSATLEGSYHEIQQQKVHILSLITGRTFDITAILAEAKKAGNPGGDLFVRLAGDDGLVPATKAQLATDLNVSESKIKKTRWTQTMQKGGFIDETFAESIMQLVEQYMRPLIAKKIVSVLTPEQREDCIDTLTNCPHPRKMLAASIAGQYVHTDPKSANDIGDIIRRSYERKGLTQAEFIDLLGMAHISNAVLGKAYFQHDTSRKLADWFGENYQLNEPEQRRLMAMAQGVDMSKTPDQLFNEVMQDPPVITRHEALRRMYDMTGLTRPKLAETAQVPDHVIEHSVTEGHGGRLFCGNAMICSIAKEIGISEPRIPEFVQVFSGKHVSRLEAMAANQRVRDQGNDRLL